MILVSPGSTASPTLGKTLHLGHDAGPQYGRLCFQAHTSSLPAHLWQCPAQGAQLLEASAPSLTPGFQVGGGQRHDIYKSLGQRGQGAPSTGPSGRDAGAQLLCRDQPGPDATTTTRVSHPRSVGASSPPEGISRFRLA